MALLAQARCCYVKAPIHASRHKSYVFISIYASRQYSAAPAMWHPRPSAQQRKQFEQPRHSLQPIRTPRNTATRGLMNPFTITLTAGCAALAYSGAVPLHDIAFSLAWPTYLAVANALRFKHNASKADQPSATAPLFPEPWVRQYAAFAGLLAVLLPGLVCIWAIVGEAVFGSSSSSIKGPVHSALVLSALGPHLYLVCSQILCEFVSSRATVAVLPRALVPIGFNAYRMWALAAWCSTAWAAGLGPWQFGLAAVNLLFWAYNLFGFLLLQMLPIYLDPVKCAV